MGSCVATERKLSEGWTNGLAEAEVSWPEYRRYQEQYCGPVTEERAYWYCLGGAVKGEVESAAEIIRKNTGARVESDWDGEGIVFKVIYPSGRCEECNYLDLPYMATKLAASGFRDPGAPLPFIGDWGS